MTFALNLSRGISLGALAAALTLGSVSAQNGTNYDELTNSFDVAYFGVGAGLTQTAADGLTTHVRGENLKGSHMTQLGDFGYRNPRFRETLCVFNNPPSGPGTAAIKFAGIVFLELNGMNGNAPLVYTNPKCANATGAAQFPLGVSGAVPYGTVPNSSVNFVLVGIPTVGSVAPSTIAVVPNDGLVGAPAGGGTVTEIGAGGAVIPIASTGFCWAVQFTWGGSALPGLDDIDSWEHYVRNSPDGNQYWGMSRDEGNIWQSETVMLDAGVTALAAFPANVDYELMLSTVEPTTKASLAPVGGDGNGAYYAQVANVVKETGAAAINLNSGFDVGRSSEAISLNGVSGVANPGTGLGNQDPTAAGKTPTLGFMTRDNGGDGNGSVRIGWVSVDNIGIAGINPDTDVGVIKPFFGIRIPVVSSGLLQGITGLCFGLFGTKTSGLAWPDPDGFPPGTFGVPAIGSASNQFPTVGLTVCPVVAGLAVNVTYGTSGRKDGPGALTYNPNIADTSGSRELFLMN